MAQGGNPLEPCPVDSLNGYHDWVAMEQKGSGDPLPGARYCTACAAVDFGPLGVRVSHKDSPTPLFPAATRSYRDIATHNPDDVSPVAEEGSVTN